MSGDSHHMLPHELLLEALQDRQERLDRLDAGKGGKRAKKPARVRDRLQNDPALADAVARVREKIENLPDVRADRVKELKKRLMCGRLDLESKIIAEKLLQETILDELL